LACERFPRRAFSDDSGCAAIAVLLCSELRGQLNSEPCSLLCIQSRGPLNLSSALSAWIVAFSSTAFTGTFSGESALRSATGIRTKPFSNRHERNKKWRNRVIEIANVGCLTCRDRQSCA
jgi:hypothetical protein